MDNFECGVDRKSTNSVKWERYKNRDVIPLWIADTDFSSPEEVKVALEKRVSHSIYGYGSAPSSLKKLLIDRMNDKYNWSIQPSEIIFTPGIVPALSLCCEAFVKENESILVQKPIYPPISSAPHRFRKKSLI